MADAVSPTGPWSKQNTNWLASAARTSSGSPFITDPIGCDRFSALILYVNVTAASGTSPTLNIYLQTLLPDNSTWTDIASLTQITNATSKCLGFVSGGNSEFSTSDGTLAAATIKAVPLGRKVRVKAIIAGTNPSFTFSIHIMFIQ